jgi:hypothetical protein
MPYAIGIALALLIGVFAGLTRFERDRAFYPTVLIVIPSYYILFATLGGATDALLFELLQQAVFTIIAVVGFKSSLWWVVAGMVGHGVFDSVHGFLVSNPGVPPWWPAFCMAIDVALGVVLAWRLYRGIPHNRSEPVIH